MGILQAAAPIIGGIFGGPTGATIGGAIGNAFGESGAASDASDAQQQAAAQGLAEQRRQFDALQKLQQPYVNAGTGALSAQQNLIGLNGNDAMQAAINSLSTSPQMQAYIQNGENALRQNAAATGGLRGGNLQAALAQFRPQYLAQLINDQYSKLGGLTSIGQNAAAGVGNAGMQSADNISNLYGQIGASQAGNSLARGKAFSNLSSGVVGAINQQQARSDFTDLINNGYGVGAF